MVIRCFFAFVNYNYARWMCIFMSEMLEKIHPQLYHNFTKYGLFVISDTKIFFFAMILNHRHEQNNKDLKVMGKLLE